jgi:putative DNA methylase
MTTKPRVLIEDWLPIEELGIESRREAAPIPGQFPKLKTLHVWWARRPLVACAGVVLASLLPTWSQELADQFARHKELADEDEYKRWVLRLCGILGDPIAAKRRIAEADEKGVTLGAKAYGYRQAFKNSPSVADLALLHEVLLAAWGKIPTVLDPTAGGGSIPYQAVRFGLPTTAVDLNAVAAVILRAGVEIPARYATALFDDLQHWGQVLVGRLEERLAPFFKLPDASDNNSYLFARTVACPRTGKLVPLAPNLWLSKEAGKQAAVRLLTHRSGRELDRPEFEILFGPDAVASDPDEGTIAGGDAVSPWDGLVIDGDFIKAEAQAGRMGSLVYAVAVRLPQPGGKPMRTFRKPTEADLESIERAEAELARLLPGWLINNIVPVEEFPPPIPKHDIRPYGIRTWRDMFSTRQLLVHGTFVEEFRGLIPEVRAELQPERADAVLGMLGMMQGKALNWNAAMTSWDASRRKLRSFFDRHDFSFKWTFAEFEGAGELFPWCLAELTEAYKEIATLLLPADHAYAPGVEPLWPVPGAVSVSRNNAGSLLAVESGSQTLVAIDPPYYDNVMYGELSDFFGVWEQLTIGKVWPDLIANGVADTVNEAVVNPVRFAAAGRRKKDLATADYQAKMQSIFAECQRVLRDDGVLSVMFTHKKATAWDTLGSALMEAGFTIETSWPVNTESEQSLHQAKLNSAASTIMLVCRKRIQHGAQRRYFEDMEADVRAAARSAVERYSRAGIAGVDLLLSTYGPALSVISSAWPVYSTEADEAGRSRLLRPEEALDAAREEVVKLQRKRLIGLDVDLDPLTDFVLLAWSMFQAASFPYDEARRLALARSALVKTSTLSLTPSSFRRRRAWSRCCRRRSDCGVEATKSRAFEPTQRRSARPSTPPTPCSMSPRLTGCPPPKR